MKREIFSRWCAVAVHEGGAQTLIFMADSDEMVRSFYLDRLDVVDRRHVCEILLLEWIGHSMYGHWVCRGELNRPWVTRRMAA